MKPRSILLFFASVLMALAILCLAFPTEGIALGGYTLRLPSLSSLNQQKTAANIIISTPEPEHDLSQLNDSISYFKQLVDSSELRIIMPSADYLDPFWKAASHAQQNNQVVRIVHYGDSQIEMDHITSRLRHYMQNTFGGGGPGMIPFRTLIPTYAVRQSTRGKLTHLSSFGDSSVVRSHGNYGPMMQSFRLRGSATADVKASKVSFVDDRVKHFSSVKLIFNNIGNKVQADISPYDTDSTRSQLWYPSGTGIFSWQFDSTIDHFQVHVSGQTDLYAMLVDNGPGVAVDNIPMRGCSGYQFTLVDQQLLHTSYRKMNIRLIILQFGGNVVPYLESGDKLQRYCKRIGEQIDYIKLCCPQAQILFIGPSDMSTRRKGQLQTYPIIPELIDSLTSTAINHGIAYWSIYHAMGGSNTMPEWTNQGLAGKDYIHFTQRGADLMGDRLATALNNSYQLFLLQQRLISEKNPQQ